MNSLEQRALFYSPLSFLRGREDEVSDAVISTLLLAERDGNVQQQGEGCRLWLRELKWDSAYFGVPSYRIEFADWDHRVVDPPTALGAELVRLRQILAGRGRYYLYADVPSEDVVFLQGLGLAGFRLIETRLTLFHADLATVAPQVRPTRVANEQDIPVLRAAAVEARNPYDRFHADPFFSQDTADEFLAEYAEQCMRGLCDTVLVPGDGGVADAFVCGRLSEPAPQGVEVGRLVLAGVATARRGWYRDLHLALLCWMREAGMSLCLNTTQSTNRAVLHVCEKLGYRFGRATHVLAVNHLNQIGGK